MSKENNQSNLDVAEIKSIKYSNSLFAKAAKSVLFTSFSYLDNKKEKHAIENFKTLFDEDGYKLLIDTYASKVSYYDHYKALVFTNDTTKELIIAHSGSRYFPLGAAASDLMNSIRYFWFEETPPKAAQIPIFIMHALSALKEEKINISDYKITFTGHSLGGVLSELAAVELATQLKASNIPHSKIDVITFENPGTASLLYNNPILAPTEQGVPIEFYTFSNRLNPINSLNESISSVENTYKILPYDQKPLIKGWVSQIASVLSKTCFAVSAFPSILSGAYPKADAPVLELLDNGAKTSGSAPSLSILGTTASALSTVFSSTYSTLSKASNLLSPYKWAKLFAGFEFGVGQLQDDHGITNFEKVLIEHKGLIIDSTDSVITFSGNTDQTQD